MLSEIFFPGDTYKTPASTGRGLLDKIMFNSRWAFYIKFLQQPFKHRKLALAGKYPDDVWSASSYEVFQVLEGSGAKFEISGMNNISKTEGPVVFIGNHMSTAETMTLPCMIAPYKKLTFVVKAELEDSKIFGPIMKSRNPITLGRQEPRKDMMKLLADGQDRLAKGYSIIIFPEGTRQKTFNPKKLNSLGVKLAGKAGVKVVPIALKTDFWGTSTFSKINRKKVLHFAFGEPIDVLKDPKKAHQDVLNFISTNLAKWKEDEMPQRISALSKKAIVG